MLGERLESKLGLDSCEDLVLIYLPNSIVPLLLLGVLNIILPLDDLGWICEALLKFVVNHEADGGDLDREAQADIPARLAWLAALQMINDLPLSGMAAAWNPF